MFALSDAESGPLLQSLDERVESPSIELRPYLPTRAMMTRSLHSNIWNRGTLPCQLPRWVTLPAM
jgi:hypothetical protein